MASKVHIEIAEEDGRIAAQLGHSRFAPAWASGQLGEAWARGYSAERSAMAARVARATLA